MSVPIRPTAGPRLCLDPHTVVRSPRRDSLRACTLRSTTPIPTGRPTVGHTETRATSGVRCRGSVVRSSCRHPVSFLRKPKTETRNPKTKTENRKLKTENRRVAHLVQFRGLSVGERGSRRFSPRRMERRSRAPRPEKANSRKASGKGFPPVVRSSRQRGRASLPPDPSKCRGQADRARPAETEPLHL